MKVLKGIRWTVNNAASEFGTTARTLAGQLKEKGILPGRDGKFSTAQICEAIYDDAEKQRIRSMSEQADHRALQNAESRGELLPVDDMAERMNRPLRAMQKRICGEVELLPEVRDELLLDLKDLYASIFDPKAPTRPGAIKALKSVSGKG
jgi:hypothetical protein